MRISRLLCVSLGLATALSAQALVKDINPTTAATSLFSSPNNGVELFGVIYFAADDGIHGRELWRTDGTAAGTRLVADINPGPASSNPSRPVWINGSSTFLFAADDGAVGSELWSSDGTAANTRLVRDINPGSASSSPLALTPVASLTYAAFFFSADDGVHGRELWRSNTTTAGTAMVSDLRVGTASAMSATAEIWDDPDPANPYCYFTADNGAIGEELWRCGNALPTLVRDINPGAPGSLPRAILDGPARLSLLFAATTATSGREPWHVISGVANLAADINVGTASSNPTSAVVAPGATSPAAFLVNGTGSNGNEPYRVVIGSGATLLRNINIGTLGSTPEFFAPTGVDGFALMAATSTLEGRELWLTDGTTAGTVLLADINPSGSSNPQNFTWVRRSGNDYFVFCADDGSVGAELWVTDLSVRGTRLLRDARVGAASSLPSDFVINSGSPRSFTLYDLDDGAHGSEPWITDATAAGTILLSDVRAPVSGSTPRELTTLGATGVVCFIAGEPTFGSELWRSDGTAAGTTLVKDIKPGNDGASLGSLSYALGKLYFRADDGATGTEPWVSDGTAAGTVRLADLAPGNASSVPTHFTEFGGYVYFVATDTTRGYELWRTDGTTAGTALFVELEAGAQGANPNGLVVKGNRLFFAATTATHGTELWATDGTVAGTARVSDINPGSASAGRNGVMTLFVWDGYVYFGADSGSGDLDLWRSDGTTAGTLMIGDFAGTVGPGEFVGLGSSVFFAADLGGAGRELWRTAGTLASTVMVSDIAPGVSSDPVGLTVGGAGIVFAAYTPAAGRELWTSDGTAAGTALVRDIYPGPANGIVVPPASLASPRYEMSRLNGSARVWFAATDLVGGIELWRTDGTAASTVRVGDVHPGAGGSRPGPLSHAGASLLLAADGGAIGTELYRLSAPPYWASFGTGCVGSSGRLPRLGANSAPRIGNSGFAVTLADARPNTSAVLLLGATPSHLSLGGGCVVLVDLFGPVISLPLITDGRGTASLPLPIPNEVTHFTLGLPAQAAVADFGAAYAGILAVSQGIELLVER